MPGIDEKNVAQSMGRPSLLGEADTDTYAKHGNAGVHQVHGYLGVSMGNQGKLHRGGGLSA